MTMTFKKVHTRLYSYSQYTLCGRFLLESAKNITMIKSKVTCNSCKRTRHYKNGMKSISHCVICGHTKNLFTHITPTDIAVTYCISHSCTECVRIVI